MSEVLTLEDFSLAKALKLYPTLKEQLLVDNGLTEKQEEEKQPLLCQQQQLFNYNRPLDKDFMSCSRRLSALSTAASTPAVM